MNVETAASVAHGIKRQGLFYGWYIVGVGFLANVASSFALASTLSIFLKPLTTELGISRGVFSLLRSGEGIIGACLAPFVGTLVDRFSYVPAFVLAATAPLLATVSILVLIRGRDAGAAMESQPQSP